MIGVLIVLPRLVGIGLNFQVPAIQATSRFLHPANESFEFVIPSFLFNRLY